MAKIHDQEASLPTLTSKVTSPNLWIGSRVREAEKSWEGKTETHPDVRETIRDYWKVLGLDHSVDIAWSAAFVSHLLNNKGFKGDSYHTTYVQYAMKGQNGGWEAFSIPKNKDKLVVSIGDVLVKPRSGTYEASHGDVVYNIRNGVADVIGGNIGHTLGYDSIGLNPDGTISNSKSYLVLLKKNSSSVPMFYARQAVVFGVLPLITLLGIYSGYTYIKTGDLPRLVKK